MTIFHKLTTVLLILIGMTIAPGVSYAAEPDSTFQTHSTHSLALYKANQPNQTRPTSNGVTLGYFGQTTKEALEAFQIDASLPVTGEANSATLTNLELKRPLHTSLLKKGQRGFNILSLQEKLVDLGYLKGSFYSGLVVHQTALEMDSSFDRNLNPTNTLVQLSVKATAYTSDCVGCTGITKTGIDLNQHPDAKVIAVDPKVIPLGSTVYVPGYGYAIAADTGGAINGHHIDIYLKSSSSAQKWGVKQLKVTVVN